MHTHTATRNHTHTLRCPTVSAPTHTQHLMMSASIEPLSNIRGSIVASISACHAEDPGSIPGLGVFIHMSLASQSHHHTHTRIRPPTHTSITAHFSHVTHTSHTPSHLTLATRITTHPRPSQYSYTTYKHNYHCGTSCYFPSTATAALVAPHIVLVTLRHQSTYPLRAIPHTHSRYHASNIPRTPSTPTHRLII